MSEVVRRELSPAYHKCACVDTDDATSNVDMETEHEIQQALKRLMVAVLRLLYHRISAVKDADEITP